MGRLPRGTAGASSVRGPGRRTAAGRVRGGARRGVVRRGSTCGAIPARSTACSTWPTGNVAAGAERVLVDPMAIDPSARTTLDHWQPDKEGRLLAYQLSSGGNEESLLRVIDVASGEVVDGPIDRCRYSGVAWLPGGKAFYYVRRLAAGPGPRRGEPVPPARVPARRGHAAGVGRDGVRRGRGQDHVLRRQRQHGRPLAGGLRLDRHRAA